MLMCSSMGHSLRCFSKEKLWHCCWQSSILYPNSFCSGFSYKTWSSTQHLPSLSCLVHTARWKLAARQDPYTSYCTTQSSPITAVLMKHTPARIPHHTQHFHTVFCSFTPLCIHFVVSLKPYTCGRFLPIYPLNKLLFCTFYRSCHGTAEQDRNYRIASNMV